jgi:hypothetical protein
MADLKPIGSERLTGQEKLNRIMEIARYKEVSASNVNETSTKEFSINLSDGIDYQIVKEKQGYIIKKTISESKTDYIEPMKNRKYFSSYSQALKKLNLMAKELNRVNENEEGMSLFGEQKKFVLKTPKPAESEMMPPAPPVEPPPVPSPELPPSPESETPDMGADMGDDGMDMSPDMGADTADMGDDGMDASSGEEVTFKMIQKLTGKLTQKIREYEGDKGLTSENIKYVINMVLSSVDLTNLSEEDKEDVLSKFESDEDMDMEDDDMGMGDEDITGDSEVEDIQSDMDVPVESEMEEGNMYGSFGNMRRKDFKGDTYFDEMDYPAKDSEIHGIGGDDFDTEEFETFKELYKKYGDKQRWFGGRDGETMFNKYKEMTGKPFKVKTRRSEIGSGDMEGMFGESKVDKVISKYFEIGASEKKLQEQKKHINEENKKRQFVKQINSIKGLSESIEQELSSKKFLQENKDYTLIGKTNKKNLVFENKKGQIKITPEGLVI